MQRKWTVLPVLMLVATLAVAGCARQEEPGGTSTDARLS